MTRYGLALSLLLIVKPALGGDAAQAARYFEDALARFEQADHAGAVIQLKNALQQDGRMVHAHLLMGRAQLGLGNPAAAEAALVNAQALGADRSEVAILLAQAYFAQGKFKPLIEKMAPDGLPPGPRQALLLLQAYAHLEQDDAAGAEIALDRAAQAGPSAELKVAQATFALHQGRLADARALADQALALTPGHAKAWNLRASVDHLRGDFPAALDGYAKALQHQPTLADARVARAGLLMDLGRMAELGRELAALKTVTPNDPRGSYLTALHLTRKGDAAGAKRALLDTARLIDGLPPAALQHRGQLLMLGALAHYGLNARAKAQSYLEGYLRLHPDHPGAGKLMGAILLADGNAGAALPVLERASRQAPRDPRIQSLLAAAYLANHQHAKAANLLEQAAKDGQASPELTAALGFSLIGLGQEDRGLEQIGRAFRHRPDDARLGNALVMLHIQRGQPREAVTHAEALLKGAGQSPAAFNLVGVARAAAGNRKGAREAYAKALALDAGFEPARLNLAKLETVEGRHEVARQHYDVILKRAPDHPQAQFERAMTEDAAGNAADALRRLERLYARDGRNLQFGAALAELYLRQGKADQALGLAKSLSGLYPDRAPVLSLLGRAHAAHGQMDRARVVFGNLSRQAGFNVDQLAQVARLQLNVGDVAGAAHSLNKALTTSPDALPVNLLMAELDLGRGALEPAEARARRMIAAHPRAAEGQRLMGDINRARGRFSAAAQAYQAALNLADTPEHALRLHQARINAGETKRALADLEAWNRKHPEVAITQLALAEAHMNGGDPMRARKGYEHYIKRFGEHPATLNNLANLLLRAGDLPGAQRHAERAYQLAPEAYSVNDTLGWLLARRGELARALRHLRDARTRAPHSGEVRYHLAYALHQSGRAGEARRELEEALRDGRPFEGRADAQALLRQLARGG